MLSIDQHQTASSASEAYQIRLHGGTDDERLIPIPPGKHSIGSGPRCQLRLTAAGVQAMECLLVRDRAGLRVRRWSDNTLLNSQPFDEAVLVDGDMLSVGPVILEIMGSAAGDANTGASDDLAESWEHGNSLSSACDAIEDMLNIDEASSQVLQPTEPNRDWKNVRTAAPGRRSTDRQSSSLVAAIAASSAATKSTVRRRSRRALDVLRQQRRDHDELLARVGELERMLAEALAETATPPADPAPELVQLRAEADERAAAMEGELGSLHEQLEARNGELVKARYAIDVLERQLIDSQHTMNAFADERVHWEEQFNEIESRLVKYVERIQELERQLELQSTPAESASTSSDESTIDWAAEAVHESAAAGPAPETPQAEVQELEAVATAVDSPPEESPSGELDWQEVVEQPAIEMSESAVETVVEPTPESPTESIDAAETGDLDVPTEEVQVGEALDHLRGLAIWREESGPKSPEPGADDSIVASETPLKSTDGPQPVSFLDRYAHLFSDDDPPCPAAEPKDNTAPLTEAVPPPEVHADEESVEQYMAKLLDRMRGGPAGGTAVTPLATSAETPNRPTVRITASAASEPQEQEAAQTKFTNLEEMKSRATAPEQASDMAAMRALANRSARRAIGIHAARKLRRSAITRVIVTALAASVSVYLLINSETWRSLSFAAGAAAGFAAVYWGFLTMGTLLKGFQLGAFDDLEDDSASDKSAEPPLPIDVEELADGADAPTRSADPAEHADSPSASETAGGADVVEVS